MNSKPTGDAVPARDPPEGRYANYFEVGQNAFEFVIDFGQGYEEQATPVIHTRIVMSPTYANLLLQTLRESVAKHCQAFGAIDPANDAAGNGDAHE